MTHIHNKNKGVLFVIIGSILFFIFAGKFLFHIIGIIIALLLINYGLYLQSMPPIWILLQEWISNSSRRRR